MSSSDGVHVAGEVQVEELHRNDLAVPAAGCAAFDAECRAHRWLANGDDALFADVAESHPEADRRGGLTFAERCRCDRRNHDVLSFGPIRQLCDCVESNLRSAGPVRFKAFEWNAGFAGNVG